MQDALFEGVDRWRGVFEELRQGGVVSTLPLWFPGDLELFVFADEVAVDVLEVEDVCPIFRDVLDVAVDVVWSVRGCCTPCRRLRRRSSRSRGRLWGQRATRHR